MLLIALPEEIELPKCERLRGMAKRKQAASSTPECVDSYFSFVHADFTSSLKSALHGLVISAPMLKGSPPQELASLPCDTEPIHGQPPTSMLEFQSTLRTPIPFDASVSNMLNAFCAGIDTNDSKRIILDEKIDDIETVLMPSTSVMCSFSDILTLRSTGATTPKYTRSDNTCCAHKSRRASL